MLYHELNETEDHISVHTSAHYPFPKDYIHIRESHNFHLMAKFSTNARSNVAFYVEKVKHVRMCRLSWWMSEFEFLFCLDPAINIPFF